MASDDYKVGDLSNLLGFHDSAQPNSTLFDRPAVKLEAKKSKDALPSSASLPISATSSDGTTTTTTTTKSKLKKKTKTKMTKTTTKIKGIRGEAKKAEVAVAGSKAEVHDDNDDAGTTTMTPTMTTTTTSTPTTTSEDAAPPPPRPPLLSKNARKRRRRQENALTESREADAFDGEEQSDKKKKKRKKMEEEEGTDEEEEEEREEDAAKKKKKFVRDPADDERTVFVGNLAKTIRKNQLVKLFSAEVGAKVVKARIRGAVSNDPKQTKKVAAITNNIHHKLDSLFAYLVFEDAASVSKAVAKMNGVVFQDRHLRVDSCKQGVSGTCDEKLSVFVGNLPFDVAEEALRKLFHDSCGDVTRVRCVRDPATRMGKGFGYVEFRSAGAVKHAVDKSESLTFAGRLLRIKRAQRYGKNNGNNNSNNSNSNSKFVGDAGRKRGKKTEGKTASKKRGKKSFAGGKRKTVVKL